MEMFSADTVEQLPSFYVWGLQVIVFIQQIATPVLTEVIKHLTNWTGFHGLVFLSVLVCFAVDFRKGLLLMTIIAFTASVNHAIKIFLQIPCPFILMPDVGLGEESGFSTPSGHSQLAAAIWPILLLYTEKTHRRRAYRKTLIALSILLPVFAGCTRMYLGVHYPTDVLFGLLLGWITAVAVLYAAPIVLKGMVSYVQKSFAAGGRSPQRSFLFMWGIGALVITIIGNDAVYLGGLVLGMGIGKSFFLDMRALSFDAASGTFLQKSMRIVIVFAVAGILYIALSIISIDNTHSLYRMYSFFEFFIIGAVIFGGLPRLFMQPPFKGRVV